MSRVLGMDESRFWRLRKDAMGSASPNCRVLRTSNHIVDSLVLLSNYIEELKQQN